MPLGTDYPRQSCSLARTLEIVGERWTLLILRDLFFGVRRFTDLQRHLDIPRAVLTSRLNALVEAGVVERRPYSAGRDELHLTECGEELWPSVHALMQWGERHRSPAGPRRAVRAHGLRHRPHARRALPGLRRRAARGRARDAPRPGDDRAAALGPGHARAARAAPAAGSRSRE